MLETGHFTSKGYLQNTASARSGRSAEHATENVAVGCSKTKEIDAFVDEGNKGVGKMGQRK